MNGRLFVRPLDGRQVRKIEDPKQIIHKDGDLVPNNSYYRRRIKFGDLLLVKEFSN